MCHNHDKNFDSIVVFLCIWLDQGRSQGGHGGNFPPSEFGRKEKGKWKKEKEGRKVGKRRGKSEKEEERGEKKERGRREGKMGEWT